MVAFSDDRIEANSGAGPMSGAAGVSRRCRSGGPRAVASPAVSCAGPAMTLDAGGSGSDRRRTGRTRVARKWRRKGLKQLNSRPEMASPLEVSTPKNWGPAGLQPLLATAAAGPRSENLAGFGA